MIPTFSQTRRLQIVTPRKATYKDLAAYHTRDYLETVLQLSRDSTKRLELDVLDNEFGLEDVCYLPFFLPVFILIIPLGLSSLPRSFRVRSTSRRRHTNRSDRSTTKHSRSRHRHLLGWRATPRTQRSGLGVLLRRRLYPGHLGSEAQCHPGIPYDFNFSTITSGGGGGGGF